MPKMVVMPRSRRERAIMCAPELFEGPDEAIERRQGKDGIGRPTCGCYELCEDLLIIVADKKLYLPDAAQVN